MSIPRVTSLVGIPVAFAAILALHPMISGYEGLRTVTTRFQLVHVAMVLAIPVLALTMRRLLDGLPGRAATVARRALVPFVLLYVPYVAFEGIALGVLGQELNGLTAAQREAVAPSLVENFARNPIMGEPGLFWALGSAAWLTAVGAAVVAFRRAGAPVAVQVAVASTALIAAHAPPLAPIGWLSFAAAGWIVLRSPHPSRRLSPATSTVRS